MQDRLSENRGDHILILSGYFKNMRNYEYEFKEKLDKLIENFFDDNTLQKV